MKIKYTVIVLLFLLAPVLNLAGGSLAHAFSDEGDRYSEFREEKRKMMDKIIGELDLSKEQVAAIEEHRKTHRDKKDVLYNEMRQKKKELRKVLHADEIDLQKADDLIDTIVSLKKKQMKSRVKAILSLKEILTPEQLQELRDKKREMKQRYRNRNN